VTKTWPFYANYIEMCKNEHNVNSDIPLISHLLGARVILCALDILHNNPIWNNNNNNFKITSVSLMGQQLMTKFP
jgi:hypothetical protein